ncbi:6-phosphogluconolactonase [bacterium]|nr:6-phosphogluconolactonase [bacterium]
MIRILKNLEQVSSVAAEEVIQCAVDATEKRGIFRIALSGGSTPKTLYSKLASDQDLKKQMPWQNTQFFWSDERTVPPDHPDSNYRMVHEAMFKHVDVSETQIHRIHAEVEDPNRAAEEYENEIRQHFYVTAPDVPQFDLILLGMGPDGHTASLFPGTEALKEQKRLIVSNWVSKFNTHRITFTVPLINHAANVMFLVCGEDKAAALKAVLEGPYDPVVYPSQLIKPEGELIWFIDQGAGKLMELD